MKLLQLREDYQLGPTNFALVNDEVVLGLAPNSGKTEISIDVIGKFLEQKPDGRVLVLAHSTNILKSNFLERLNGFKLPFTYSSDLKSKVQVHVTIPQNHKSITGKYDFVIVDEAHENYFEKQVQGIIKKVSPKKQLLLTGTPSKFIKKGGFKIYTLALNQIPEQYQAKLNIDLVATNYKWSSQLNEDLEVKRDYKFTIKDTEDAMELIILKLIERVRLGFSPKDFNISSIKTKIKTWAYTYKKLGKTIIVCNNVKQSEDVNKTLIKNGVNSTVSNSISDTDSEEITNFKNGEYDVLVVVKRARLGYSDENLFNIIDMSGTHNPNIINQMFSRALRGTPDQLKYYLKVTTQEYGMMDFTHACVCASLMLTDNKYLSTFNGDNFNGIPIPVKKKQIVSKNNKSSTGKISKKQAKKYEFPEFTNDVIDFFKNVIHDLDKPTSIYKTTTIREVKAILSGRMVWTKENIFLSAAGKL